MDNNTLTFSLEQFGKVFPFFLVINRELIIESTGVTITKLIPTINESNFKNTFNIKRPAINNYDFDALKLLQNQLVVLEDKNGSTGLRCQLEYLEETDRLLFIGSPWFPSMEDVIAKNLTLDDFAVHDPLIDLLHVLKTQEIANDDMKTLLYKFSAQKKELKEANQEISDIALFPTQNPDPLIRIDQEGNLLKRNPAADELQLFEHQGKLLSQEDFWKEIAKTLNPSNNRVVVEATDGNEIYSFIVVSLPQLGYYTIYGRKITEQNRMEKELSASASRLSSLIQNLHAGVLLEDEHRHIALINKEFCSVFGIPVDPEMLVGTDCSQAAEQSKHLFVNPDEFVSRIQSLLKDRKNVVNELLELKDGRFLQRDFIPIWTNEKYSGHLWLYVDVTDKINAENRIEKQRLFYEEILNSINSGISVLDNQLHYLFVNPKSIPDNKWRKWAIGKTDLQLSQQEVITDANAEKRFEIYQKVLKTGKLQSFEEAVVDTNGTINYILYTVHPVTNEQNEIDMLVIYGVDITDIRTIQLQMKASEKRFRDVIENSLALITTHDLDGRILTVNPMVRNVYGYSASEMAGTLLTNYMMPEDKHRYNDYYLPQIRTAKQMTGVSRLRAKDGKIVYTLYNNFLKEEEGEEPYVIGYGVDITERITVENELKKAKAVTEKLSNAKQEFLANMSHEIRTPLNAIIGLSEQLLKTKIDNKQASYLNTINEASDHLLSIVNDILDISKMEAGKLALEHVGFEPKQLVGKALQMVSHKAQEKGLKLTNSSCDFKLANILIGDPYRISQVLFNLMSNAVKYTERGFVDLRCVVSEEKNNVQTIKIIIEDTGIGMDKEFITKLFDQFTQEIRPDVSPTSGTGLGMSITKKLIELMGGEIEVESELNKGTTIAIILPLKVGTMDDLPKKFNAVIDQKFLQGKTILVADDNENNRLVSSVILTNYGATVVEADNGKEVLDVLKNEVPDLILMDLQMPEMNGIEATKIIRKLGLKLPILALTANVVKGEREKCLAAGMNDYVSKPFKEAELLQKLAAWLMIDVDIKKVPKSIESKEISDELFNYDKLHAISPGNDDFVHRMAELFCKNVPEMLTKMENAIEKEDIKTIASLAHKMKPSVEDLNINNIVPVVKELDALKGDELNYSHISSLVYRVTSVLREVIKQIRLEQK